MYVCVHGSPKMFKNNGVCFTVHVARLYMIRQGKTCLLLEIAFIERLVSLWRGYALIHWQEYVLVHWREYALVHWREYALVYWQGYALVHWREYALVMVSIMVGLIL